MRGENEQGKHPLDTSIEKKKKEMRLMQWNTRTMSIFPTGQRAWTVDIQSKLINHDDFLSSIKELKVLSRIAFTSGSLNLDHYFQHFIIL